MLRPAWPVFRCAILGLLLLSGCAGPRQRAPRTAPKRTSPVRQAQHAPIDQLLERLRQERPLVAGQGDSVLRNPTCLVRSLQATQLDRLLQLGHKRVLIQALFVPGAGDHPAHGALLDGLRKLQAQSPSREHAALIESLSLPPAWRRAERLQATNIDGAVRVSVSHWNVPILSLARALRSTGGHPDATTRALLAAALKIQDR